MARERYYEVNAANTSDIRGTSREGRTYAIDTADPATQTGPWTLQLLTPTADEPGGSIISLSRLNQAYPEYNLYLANEDNTQCPPYHTRTKTLAFVGTLGSAAARVQETVVCTPISLDDLLATKLGELDQYASFVRVQSTLSTTNNNFWISLDPDSRDVFAAVDWFYYGDRLKDRVLGTDSAVGYASPPDPDPSTWWAQDVEVMLIRDSNGNRLISKVGEADYGQVLKDMGFYDTERRVARVNAANAIDAAYQASDFNALAAIDVQSAAYGWPAFYTGTVSASVRVL